jgi:hypothetical protein
VTKNGRPREKAAESVAAPASFRMYRAGTARPASHFLRLFGRSGDEKSDVLLKVLVCVLLVNLGLLAGGWPPFGPIDRPAPESAPSVNPQLVVADPARRLGWQLDTEQGGAVLRVTDPAGQKTIIRRELEEGKRLRWLVKELPGGGKVVHEFDDFGRRTALKDASGTTRRGFFRALTGEARGGPAGLGHLGRLGRHAGGTPSGQANNSDGAYSLKGLVHSVAASLYYPAR